jgi:hypothetical protein
MPGHRAGHLLGFDKFRSSRNHAAPLKTQSIANVN